MVMCIYAYTAYATVGLAISCLASCPPISGAVPADSVVDPFFYPLPVLLAIFGEMAGEG